MGHAGNAGQVLEKADIPARRVELVVGDDCRYRLPAELTVLGDVDVLVETGLDDFRRVVKVLRQLSLGDIQDLDLDVLPELGSVDEEFQTAPGRLELPEFPVVQNLVELRGHPVVDAGDHLVHSRGMDPVSRPGGTDQLGKKGRHAVARGFVPFIVRRDPGLAHDLLEQALPGALRDRSALGICGVGDVQWSFLEFSDVGGLAARRRFTNRRYGTKTRPRG